MRNNRRWANGRRLYSWERKGGRRTSQPQPEAPEAISGAIGAVASLLLVSWLFFKPLFWIIVVVLGFIAACFLVMGIASLVIWWEKTSQTKPSAKKIASDEKAIGQTAKACVADYASSNVKEANMTHDKRFALIDRDGDARYAAIIAGTYQIGKGRDALPTNVEDFARAILMQGKDGRFVCADGRKPGVLKYSGRAQEARAYKLDPTIARKLGIPPQGKR